MYVAAAIAVAHGGRVIPRVLYDGLAPAAPYRFMSPPPELAQDNEPPEPGHGVVDIVDGKAQATSISTGDGQLQVVLQKGSLGAKRKEKEIEVDIVPLVPDPPLDVAGGLRIEGNAYRVTATYQKSRDPAPVKRDLTIVLRFPYTATKLVRRDGNTWKPLTTQISQASLQLFGATDRLGVFAGAGKPHSNFWKYVPYAAGAFGVVAGILGYLSGRRGWLRRRRGGDRKGRKRKPPPRAKRGPGTQV
jgi:hypothetical protein